MQRMPLQAAPFQVFHAVFELPPRQGVGFDGVPFLKYLQQPSTWTAASQIPGRLKGCQGKTSERW